MEFLKNIRNRWSAFWTQVKTTMAPADRVIGTIGKWIWRLRGLFMAIPVVILAWKLAAYCNVNLPENVGVNLLSTGEFQQYISRQSAVMVPFYITLGCLGLMCCSRKPLALWVVSIFSMAIPLLLLLTNNMQALFELYNLIFTPV